MRVKAPLGVLLIDSLERKIEPGSAAESALKEHDRIGLNGERLQAQYLRLCAFLDHRTLDVKHPAILTYSVINFRASDEAALLRISWRVPDVAKVVGDLQQRNLSR